MRGGFASIALWAAAVVAQTPHELALDTFEGHTPFNQPANWSWATVPLCTVCGSRFKDPTVTNMGVMGSADECQMACAKNSTCMSYDFATGNHDGESCGRLHRCYFRSDTVFQPSQGSSCTDVAGRKVAPTPAPPPTPPPTPMPPPKPPLGYQPNVVFFLTDDQDTRMGHDKSNYTELGSMEVMPLLQKHFMTGGARMSNAFVNTPICCPSRTEFFSGRLYHNIGPPNDPGSCMHVDTDNVGKKNTGLFGLMVKSGYEVGVFGKVTNDNLPVLKLMSAEKSMTWSSSPINYNSYDGTTWYRDFGNGTNYTETLDKASPVYGTTYQTAQIGNRTLDWLDMLQKQGKIGKKPFFAYLGPHAPHYPAEPAPWYQQAFPDATIPITPNYNTSFADKTQHIRQNPPLSKRAHCWQNRHFRDRWASLLSVDDLVDAVIGKLDELKVLDKTFLFYSSDHGYKQGQWRVGTSKEHPFETDIRGIQPGSVFPHITGNVDVTPTILDLAGIDVRGSLPFMDGHSMRPWLLSSGSGSDAAATVTTATTATTVEGAPWRDRWLVEYLAVGTYYNDHSSAWQDGQNTTQLCGGKMPRGPDDANTSTCVESEGVGDGNCYFVDSTHSNSWRSLRIINADEDTAYTEYDPTWIWANSTTGGLPFYELYDLRADPFQMKNLYPTATAERKTELAKAIATYYSCGGDSATPSTCP